jgi:hypothetical protein
MEQKIKPGMGEWSADFFAFVCRKPEYRRGLWDEGSRPCLVEDVVSYDGAGEYVLLHLREVGVVDAPEDYQNTLHLQMALDLIPLVGKPEAAYLQEQLDSALENPR